MGIESKKQKQGQIMTAQKKKKKQQQHRTRMLQKYGEKMKEETSTTKKFNKYSFSCPTLLLGFHTISLN